MNTISANNNSAINSNIHSYPSQNIQSNFGKLYQDSINAGYIDDKDIKINVLNGKATMVQGTSQKIDGTEYFLGSVGNQQNRIALFKQAFIQDKDGKGLFVEADLQTGQEKNYTDKKGTNYYYTTGTERLVFNYLTPPQTGNAGFGAAMTAGTAAAISGVFGGVSAVESIIGGAEITEALAGLAALIVGSAALGASAGAVIGHFDKKNLQDYLVKPGNLQKLYSSSFDDYIKNNQDINNVSSEILNLTKEYDDKLDKMSNQTKSKLDGFVDSKILEDEYKAKKSSLEEKKALLVGKETFYLTCMKEIERVAEKTPAPIDTLDTIAKLVKASAERNDLDQQINREDTKLLDRFQRLIGS